MITVIVVDDENIARRRLVRLLEETGEARVVAECAGGRDAVDKVAQLRPQMVFLDVQMPDLDGFGVLQQLEGIVLPAFVFVTAFDQYAVRASTSMPSTTCSNPMTPRGSARRSSGRRSVSRAAPGRTRTSAFARCSAITVRCASATEREHLDRVAVKVDGILRIVRKRTWTGGRRTVTMSDCTSDRRAT